MTDLAIRIVHLSAYRRDFPSAMDCMECSVYNDSDFILINDAGSRESVVSVRGKEITMDFLDTNPSLWGCGDRPSARGFQIRHPPKILKDIEVQFTLDVDAAYDSLTGTFDSDVISFAFKDMVDGNGVSIRDKYGDEWLRTRPNIRRYIERAESYYSSMSLLGLSLSVIQSKR